jgi:aminopeptidase N
MSNKHCLLLFIVAFSFFVESCKSSQKLNKKSNEIQTVVLDTLEIIRSKDDLYQASATKEHDMVHTHLKISFDWKKQHLIGQALLTLRPHFYPSKQLILDAKGMQINSVKNSSNSPLNYTYDSLKLYVELDKIYNGGENYTIIIDYISKPNERQTGGSRAISSDKGLYFINPESKENNKPRQIWTQGETESNSAWYPCIDKPNQKTTQLLEITVDKVFETLSNGNKTKSIDNTDGTRTDFWQMNEPHAPYLTMMAVGEFAIIKDIWKGKELSYYVEPEYKDVAKRIFGNTAEMIDFFESRFGIQYPWSKYAQVVVRDYVSGAMENTTATIHGEFVQRTARQLIDESHQDIIAHELAHQWFGDLVTCESWSNLPLNESFATYSEYLWNEYKYGKLYADIKQQRQVKGYFSEAKHKNVNLIRYYYDDKEDMFDAHSYNKGGAILHMLRNLVGDEAFFATLRLYLKNNAFGAAEIHHLRLAFEEVTGRDMNKFFNQWFFQSGHPVIDVNYSSDEDSVYIQLSQKHNVDLGQVYNLPMMINVFYGNVIMTYPVVFKYAKQRFAFPAFGNPDLIDVDADRILLGDKKENKTAKQFAFQLEHSSLYKSKSEALDGLKSGVGKDELSNNAFKNVMKDKDWLWRREAIRKLRSDSITQTVFLEDIKKIAVTDSSSLVRAEALSFLLATKRKDLIDVYTKAINDSSYRCVANALEGIFITDTAKATLLALDFLKEPDGELKNISYTILSKEKSSRIDTLFRKKIKEETGYVRYALLFHYANYLCFEKEQTVNSGLQYLFDVWEAEQNKDNTNAVKRAIERVRDYVAKRTDADFAESTKTLASSLIDKMKK